MPLYYFTLCMHDHSVSEPFAHELPDLEAALALASEAAAKLNTGLEDTTSPTAVIEVHDSSGVLLDSVSPSGTSRRPNTGLDVHNRPIL
ncbi:hypothetical protein JJB09_18660 [Rhizobium sp. KVB221]|uniref:DUF6894 domain-containing protein n=1 Tax=Rhizobium setariae TaxID=2801340 RepID=A0A937CR75_9HYPH|nr:hypothetical protein [Rhizobium setariae]MBL0374047.1 hypothetical protein [Rhizobium setariae]